MPLYQACALENYNSSTQTCSNPTWVDVQGLLPPLSIEDSLLISSAIIGAWAIGFGFKIIRKFIFK